VVAIPSARLVEVGVAGGAGHGLAQVQAQLPDGDQAAAAGWFGAGGHGRNPGQNSEKGIAAPGGHKKAPPMAGTGGQSRLQSGLGLCAQRRGNALAEATAPAEGSYCSDHGHWTRNLGWSEF